MARLMESLGIDRLSVEERMQLVEEIWDSIAAGSERSPLTNEQKREIDRRLAELDDNPDDVLTWDQVRSEVRLRE